MKLTIICLLLLFSLTTYAQKKLIVKDLSVKPDSAMMEKFPNIYVYRVGQSLINDNVYGFRSGRVSQYELYKQMSSMNDPAISQKISQAKTMKGLYYLGLVVGSVVILSNVKGENSNRSLTAGLGIQFLGIISGLGSKSSQKSAVTLYNNRANKMYYSHKN